MDISEVLAARLASVPGGPAAAGRLSGRSERARRLHGTLGGARRRRCSADGSATYGNEGGPQRAFGATSLKTDGKIFAMLVKERLVVKLSAARVAELVGRGRASGSTRATAGSRRSGSPSGCDPAEWRALATESEAFVAKRRVTRAATVKYAHHGGLTSSRRPNSPIRPIGPRPTTGRGTHETIRLSSERRLTAIRLS